VRAEHERVPAYAGSSAARTDRIIFRLWLDGREMCAVFHLPKGMASVRFFTDYNGACRESSSQVVLRFGPSARRDIVKRGDRVRVKPHAKNAEQVDRGRTGIVIADSEPGETVLVEFDDEAITHEFVAADLAKIG